MSSEQVTIKDIARKLNVSPSTVSRALRDNPEIGEATKKAVQELAKELNYQPNSVAMSLRQKKTYTIGVIVPEIVHYFFSSVISGIEEVVYDNNFQVILCQSNEKYNQELMNIKTLAQSQVDGILISFAKETKNFDHLYGLKDKGIPVVCYDRSVDSQTIDSVIVDDFGGAYKATKHLIEEGCKKIAHFRGPLHLRIHQDRYNGYLKAQQDLGVAIDPDLTVEADSFKSGYKAVHRLLDKKLDFDGIFSVNDLTAVGAMKGIKSRGLQIPGDVAVVGFGDDSTLSEMVDPALSSVVQPGFDMGIAATQLLLKKINGNHDGPQFIQLKTSLKIRESSRKNSVRNSK
jgi:DNA-binding LacI/PurR family transcriptional regulator